MLLTLCHTVNDGIPRGGSAAEPETPQAHFLQQDQFRRILIPFITMKLSETIGGVPSLIIQPFQ